MKRFDRFGSTFTNAERDPKIFFRYTDLQWALIVGELPDDADMDEVRCYCEAICDIYQLHDSMLKANKSQKKHLAQFAKKAGAVLEIWPRQLLVRPISNPNQPADVGPRLATSQYYTLLETQVWAKEKSKLARAPKKGPDYFARNLFIWRLIFYWARLGGPVTTEKSPVSGIAGGKLIRFLVAAANPVLKKRLTPAAADSEVRKYRANNNPPYAESFQFVS
jgi:hypothetical protein